MWGAEPCQGALQGATDRACSPLTPAPPAAASRRGNPSTPGKAEEAQGAAGGGREKASEGEARGAGTSAWPPSAPASPVCQRGTKQARSGELPSARSS